MGGKRLAAWMAAVLMTVCILSGCGLGGRGDLLALNYSSINKMLQEDNIPVTVSSSETLNEAVAQMARALEGAPRPHGESNEVKTRIARQTGTMPLICTITDRSYWPNSPLGNPDRHEKTAVSFAEQLYQKGKGNSYKAAVAGFTTKEGDRMLLFVMSK